MEIFSVSSFQFLVFGHLECPLQIRFSSHHTTNYYSLAWKSITMANVFDETEVESDLGYIFRVSGPCKLLFSCVISFVLLISYVAFSGHCGRHVWCCNVRIGKITTTKLFNYNCLE